ncbi:DUF7344 domain-containing protein [Salinirubrum litoreum]|uniref:DUF7344 domain-containing protein n=1 Tax=Salinirubrum litoreum TaxID=1126234 RepID=A0ABD5RC40_9EURY|nr:hypothetical protein [Salinirubrum litoreum]
MLPVPGPDEGERTTLSGRTLDDRPGFGGVSEADRRARIVSLVTERTGREHTVGDLAAAMVAWLDESNDGMTPTETEVHETLYEVDLPALERQGKLVFDPETGRVTVPGDDRRVVGAADDGVGARFPTSVRWLALVAATALGVGVAATGVGPLRPVHALVPVAGLLAATAVRVLRRR